MTQFVRSEIKKLAKNDLENKIFGQVWVNMVLATLIVSALTGALPLSYSIISNSDGTTSAVYTMSTLAVLIFSGPLNIGITNFFLKRKEGITLDLSEIFKFGFGQNLTRNIKLGIMISIYLTLWTLLFIIPGIVKGYSYSMAYYLACKHPEYSWKECIANSSKLTKGYKWKMFSLDLSFLGWYIVGILTVVGTLWVSTYHRMALIEAYELINSKSEEQDLENEEETSTLTTIS